MSAVPEDVEHEAEDEDGILREVQRRLALAAEAESDDRIRGLKAIEFRELAKQWDEDVAKQRGIDGRPALTINRTDTVCTRVENTLRQQRPRIKCHPTGGGARVETANVATGLIRHIEVQSNAGVAYDAAGKSAINIGWGYVRVGSDYVDDKTFDQELKILPVQNTFTVYMDPAAQMPAGEDADWVIISETMKRADYKLKFPDADNADFIGSDAPGDLNLMWDNKEEIRLAEYFRIHEVRDTLYMLADGRTALKSQLPDTQVMMATGTRLALDSRGKPIQRATLRREVQWFKINGCEIVERRTLPGKHIPVFRCEGKVVNVNGRVTRKGMVEDLMDPARMFNYWRTAETERYALAPKAPWVAFEDVIEGHPEWQDANRKSYSTLLAKAVHDSQGNLLPLPVRQEPVQIEAGMMEAAQGARSDFMEIAGLPMESADDEARVVSGNKYFARRQGERDLAHFHFYDNQTYMIMWVGIYLLDVIPAYYDTRRMQRIIGDDGSPQMVEINNPENSEQDAAIYNIKNNLTVGKYDVVMDTGPGYQTKREESTEAVIGLLGTPLGEPIVKVGSDIVVRNMDFAGADELADRLATTTPEGMKKAMEALPPNARAIVGALQQQIQQMQGVMQQQALELKYKGTIEAAKLEAADTKSQREDKTKRSTNELDNQVKLQVAELGAAAQLLNTRAESEHEQRQTERLIDQGIETGLQKPKHRDE